MVTPRYAFLDTWVFSLLRDPGAEGRLTKLLRSGRYTVVLTSLSFTELFNPGWKTLSGSDRIATAARFLARLPCVIVNPRKVFEGELAADLSPLRKLPVELDLAQLSPETREPVLLALLQRSDVFRSQGHDVERWNDNYGLLKRTWLADVDRIIQSACDNGYLRRDPRGRFVGLEACKELFLLSLDLRLAESSDIDHIVAAVIRRRASGQQLRLTSVRTTSLCFWYSYVDVDASSRTRRSGSDIGDFYQLSMLPYCRLFTTDSTMRRVLLRIREPVAPTDCVVLSKRELEAELAE